MALRWYGAKAKAHVRRSAGVRVAKTAKHLKNRIREAVSIPNVGSLGGEKRDTAGRYAKRTRGGNPSKPGEYPRKLIGAFRRSVQDEFDAELVEARVGSNLSYAKWLQLGTRKMEPRPWLSNALRDYAHEMTAILEGDA